MSDDWLKEKSNVVSLLNNERIIFHRLVADTLSQFQPLKAVLEKRSIVFSKEIQMSNQILIDSLRLAAKVLDSVATDQLYNSEVKGSMMQLIKDIRSKSDNLLMVAKLLETASQKDNAEVPF